MPQNDELLVKKALDGEEGAFREIVEKYQRLVFNIVYHYLGNSADVEDLAQEVFLRFFQALDRYDPARPLRAWLGRIASNLCFDELRRRKRQHRVLLLSDITQDERDTVERLYESSQHNKPLSTEEAETCLRVLERAMGLLSPKDRMAYVLREVEGLQYAELAEIFKASEVAVRIRVSRAKQQLRVKLEGLLDGTETV